jgi:putative hemolysin
MLLIELLLIFFLILVNAFFAASEISLVSLRKSRVRQLAKAGNPLARQVQKLQEEPERFLATVQIGVTLVGTLASAVGGVIAVERIKPFFSAVPVPFIQKAAGPLAVTIVVSVITYITIVVGELVPKSLAIRYSEKIAFATATPIHALSRLFSIILRVLAVSNNFILKLFRFSGREESGFISEDEIKYLIREGRKKGVFESSEEDLIHSVFKFTDTVVREVMVPRTEITGVEANSDLHTILQAMNEKGYSRIPVYEGSIDNIIGIISLKDVLPFIYESRPFVINNLLRKPYIVPPNKKVSVLLKEMRERRIHLALVGDEYGGTDGLVTMEDLIEEIVGDIRDEQEKELKEIEQIAENRFVVDGRTDIGKLNEKLGIRLPEEEFETVGGFVLGLFGRLPAEGDQIRYQDILFTVLRLRKNRIARVRILKMTKANNDEGQPAEA